MSLRPPDVDAAHAAELAARVGARAAEAGLADVAYATIDSPVGRLVGAVTAHGVVRLAYEDLRGGLDPILDDLAARLSPRIVEAPGRLDGLRRELDEYFGGRRTSFDVPVDWALSTGFTRRVLRATAAIAFGQTSTYKQIAAAAGSPAAFRATGTSLGANPIPIVVPCHRVLATGGGIGGYTGGLRRKEHLLAVEGVLPGRLT